MRHILTEQSSEAEAKNELSPKLTQLMGPLWPWQVATATPDLSFMFQILTEQSLEPDARRSWGVSEGFFHRPIEKQYIVIIMIVIFIIMIVIFIIIYSIMGLLWYKAQKCIWYCLFRITPLGHCLKHGCQEKSCMTATHDIQEMHRLLLTFIYIIATNDSIAFDNWQGPITLKQAYMMMLLPKTNPRHCYGNLLNKEIIQTWCLPQGYGGYRIKMASENHDTTSCPPIPNTNDTINTTSHNSVPREFHIQDLAYKFKKTFIDKLNSKTREKEFYHHSASKRRLATLRWSILTFLFHP